MTSRPGDDMHLAVHERQPLVGRDLRTEELVFNMGPQHPATHGVLRVVIKSDGEVVRELEPHVGNLHRCSEKIGESIPYAQWLPYVDRWDYLAAINNEHVACMAIERLGGIEVPERAEYVRVIMAEIQRILSHLMAIGVYGLDLGAFTPFLHQFRERERGLDLLDHISGGRLLYHYVRIGGVRRDVSAEWLDELDVWLDPRRERLPEYNTLLLHNHIFQERTCGIGVIDRETAIRWGVSGPALRAAGVDFEDPALAGIHLIGHSELVKQRAKAGEMFTPLSVDKFRQFRRVRKDLLGTRVFAVEYAQRILLEAPLTVSVQLASIGIQITYQSVPIGSSGSGRTQGVKFEANLALDTKLLPEHLAKHDEFRIYIRSDKPENFRTDLMKLPIPAFLGPLVAEHRPGIEHPLRLIEEQAVLLQRARAACSALRAQGDTVAVPVSQRVHFFVDDIGRLADPTAEQLGRLQQGQLHLFIGIAAEHTPQHVFDQAPAPSFVRKNVAEASNRLNHGYCPTTRVATLLRV